MRVGRTVVQLFPRCLRHDSCLGAAEEGGAYCWVHSWKLPAVKAWTDSRGWHHYLVAGRINGLPAIKPGIATNLQGRLDTHRRNGLDRVVAVSRAMPQGEARWREAQLLSVLDLFAVGRVKGVEHREGWGEALAKEYIDEDLDATPLLDLLTPPDALNSFEFPPPPPGVREAASRRIFGSAVPTLSGDGCDSLREAVTRAMGPWGADEIELYDLQARRRAEEAVAEKARREVLDEFGPNIAKLADEVVRLREALAAHPRVGGEHDGVLIPVEADDGSSPHGRGTRPSHR